jgi:hypothetical protein
MTGRKSNKQKETEMAKNKKGGPLDKHFLRKIDRNASDQGLHEVLDESARMNTERSLESVADEPNNIFCNNAVESRPSCGNDNANNDARRIDEILREFDEEDVILSDDEEHKETNDFDAEDNLDEEDERTGNNSDIASSSMIHTVNSVKYDFSKGQGIYISVKKGQLWVRAANPLVKLKISSNNVHPDSFYEKDLFIWCPKTIFPNHDFRCMHENCEGSLNFDGWPNNPCARRVYSLGISYYILGRIYKCSICQKIQLYKFKFFSVSTYLHSGYVPCILDTPCWN